MRILGVSVGFFGRLWNMDFLSLSHETTCLSVPSYVEVDDDTTTWITDDGGSVDGDEWVC